MSQRETLLAASGLGRAYSTGKTSLIRRLLHERDLPCPDALSVAADPTTFEPLDVEAGVAVLRDTPGLGSGKDLHNRRVVRFRRIPACLKVFGLLGSFRSLPSWDLS